MNWNPVIFPHKVKINQSNWHHCPLAHCPDSWPMKYSDRKFIPFYCFGRLKCFIFVLIVCLRYFVVEAIKIKPTLIFSPYSSSLKLTLVQYYILKAHSRCLSLSHSFFSHIHSYSLIHLYKFFFFAYFFECQMKLN